MSLYIVTRDSNADTRWEKILDEKENKEEIKNDDGSDFNLESPSQRGERNHMYLQLSLSLRFLRFNPLFTSISFHLLQFTFSLETSHSLSHNHAPRIRNLQLELNSSLYLRTISQWKLVKVKVILDWMVVKFCPQLKKVAIQSNPMIGEERKIFYSWRAILQSERK